MVWSIVGASADHCFWVEKVRGNSGRAFGGGVGDDEQEHSELAHDSFLDPVCWGLEGCSVRWSEELYRLEFQGFSLEVPRGNEGFIRFLIMCFRVQKFFVSEDRPPLYHREFENKFQK